MRYFDFGDWRKACFFFVVTCGLSQHSMADDTIFWVAPPNVSADWLLPANWSSPNPTSFYEFRIENDGTALLQSGIVSGAAGRIGSVNGSRLVQSGGTLELAADPSRTLYLGLDEGTRGDFDLSGGIAHVNAIDVATLGQAELLVSGGELRAEQWINVGKLGVVNHTGGSVQLAYGGGFTSARVIGGRYNMNGGAQVSAPFLGVFQGGYFNQEGGVVDLTTGAELIGTNALPSIYRLSGDAQLRADGLTLNSDSPQIGARFIQEAGRAETRNLTIKGGEYQMTGGFLHADAIEVNSPVAKESRMTLGGSVLVDSTFRIGGGNGPVSVDLPGGALDARRLYMPSESVARIHQSEGSVVVDSLEITAEPGFAAEATYRLSNGILVVNNDVKLGGTLANPSALSANLDFAGGKGVFATGKGSHVEFGSHVTIQNAEQAKLQLGRDSLLIAPSDLDLDAAFGAFQHHNVVRYERGSVLQVEADQTVQVGGLNTRDGLDIEGRIYRNPGRGSTESVGHFRVGMDGQADLGLYSRISVQNVEDAGVHGGMAHLGHLAVGNAGADARFVVDHGGVLQAYDTIAIRGTESKTSEFELNGGHVSGYQILVERHARFRQTAGEIQVSTFSVGDFDAVATVGGGELHTKDLSASRFGRIEQTGGLVVIEKLLLPEAKYLLGANAELRVKREFSPNLAPATIDFQGSAGELKFEGAFVDFSQGVPFVNASKGHVTFDEHSLLLLPSGFDLGSVVGNLDNRALVGFKGQPITIPADREIRGTGILKLDVMPLTIDGKMLAEGGLNGFQIGHFHIRPGAEVDLGIGTAYSIADGVASQMTGGVLRTNRFIVEKGANHVFRQTDGEVFARTLEIQSNSTYELSGGTLSVVRPPTVSGKIDFANGEATLAVAELGFLELDHLNAINSNNAHIRGSINSLIVVPPNYDVDQFASIESDGIIHTRGTELTIGPGQSVGGEARIVGDVVNDGLVSPGLGIGRIEIDGDFVQSASGTLLIEVMKGNAAPAFVGDRLHLMGAAELGGGLEVRITDGFQPAPGSVLTLLSASDGIFGAFADVHLPTIDGLLFRLNVNGNDLNLEVVPAMDCAVGDTLPCDGRVNLIDLNNVRNEFGAGMQDGPRIVGDAFPFDGLVNVDDLNAVRNNFGAVGSSTSVPEPSGFVIASLAAALLTVVVGRRTRAP